MADRPPGVGDRAADKSKVFQPAQKPANRYGLGSSAPAIPEKLRSYSPLTAYKAYIQKHPKLSGLPIYEMAREYNVDPVYLASWINKAGIRSIMPSSAVGQALDGDLITSEDARDPNFMVRYGAAALRATLESGATYKNAIPGVGKDVPKGYVFTAWKDSTRPIPGTGDPHGDNREVLAAERAAKKLAKTKLSTDPWVVGVSSSGKLLTSKVGKELMPDGSYAPPENALTYDGQPMHVSDFLSAKRGLEQTYVSFTGQRPSNGQVAQFIEKGWSEYQLQNLLSKTPAFKTSPLWKAKAPEYKNSAEGLFAKGDSGSPELMRQAIVNQWDRETFKAEVRKRDGYVKSTEFVGNEATMAKVYNSIYGDADALSQNVIKEATLGGWQPEQFAAWLRSQDEYVYTQEYRAKATSLVEQLGFLTGKVATLSPTKIKGDQNKAPEAYGALPNDKRLKGKADIQPGVAFMPGTR